MEGTNGLTSRFDGVFIIMASSPLIDCHLTSPNARGSRRRYGISSLFLSSAVALLAVGGQPPSVSKPSAAARKDTEH
jgi:hypothetical protein